MSGRIALVGLLVVAVAGCNAQATDDGRLSFKAHAPVAPVVHGRVPLGLVSGDDARDGFLFVPNDNKAGHSEPMLILLHGATQRSRLFERVTAVADTMGVVILAPDSRDYTWDAIRGGFGPDIEFLDRAIMRAFDRAYIDPCRVVVGGFSDGASYAISLGIRNARRFQGVVAFSAGFAIPAREVEKVPVFMRHGRQDQILPIDRASRPLLAALKEAGFTVDYEEFDGPHTMRPVDARAAMQWVAARSCSG